MAKQLEDMGAHSLCIKDMAGLLKPYDAAELIGRLKRNGCLTYCIALPCDNRFKCSYSYESY